MSHELYESLRHLVVRVRDEGRRHCRDLAAWNSWASGFTAGLCSARAAWQAAESARHAAALTVRACDRWPALAAEEAAWAVAHAVAGNVVLALESSARARQLMEMTAG